MTTASGATVPESRHFEVPGELTGARADRVVAVVCGVPRSVARRIVDAGDARLDGIPVSASQRLDAGVALEVILPDVADGLEPSAVPFEVRYEDPVLVVVDKPPGVVVHPGAGSTEPTLVAGLVHRYPELGDLSTHRWGLVHRLDRDTSGLLLVARTAPAHEKLQDDLRRRTISRTYLTLVSGAPDSVRGTIDAPIGRDRRHPTRMAVRHDGRPARTHYLELATWDDAALLEVTLETGRTHQIRVHMASIGHEVIGDRVYGRPGRRHRIQPERQWLHAVGLGFDHPDDGRSITVDSPLPDDLAATLPALGAPVWGTVGDP